MPFTRDFLKKTIEGITDAQVDAIMGEHGSAVSAHTTEVNNLKTQVSTLTTERDGFKTQLDERDKDIKSLSEAAKGNEALQKQYADLQTKYETETKTLSENLEKQAYQHEADKFFGGIKFSTNLAKKAAMSEFLEKGFKLENGKFLGAEEFINDLKKSEPTAFVPDEDPNNQQTPPPPRFANPTGSGNAGGGQEGNKNPFDMSGFNMVRPFDKK